MEREPIRRAIPGCSPLSVCVYRQNKFELALTGTIVNVALQNSFKDIVMKGRWEQRGQDEVALCLPCSETGF